MDTSTVIVVGAGPSGLTLACGLAAAGVDVRVIDHAGGPAATSRANILHARGAEVLSRVDALGDLPQRSLAPVGMTMHARGKPLSTMRFAPDATQSSQALFVSQANVESALRQRLADLGVKVEWQTGLRELAADDGGVSVGLTNGSAARAAWLVGCDGAHSTVRKSAGIDFPGVPVVEQFLLADVHADWDRDRSTSAGWFHRDGMLLAIPMRDAAGRGDLWRLMADVPATGQRLDTEQILDRFAALLPERAAETGVRFREAIWTSVFRIQRRLATDYRRGRVLLAGDAAHIHSPIGGQGMNTGIGDAENLAWKLALVAQGRAEPALLNSYTAERRPLATEVLRRTTGNTRILAGDTAISRFVRDRLFVPMLNLPAVQRKATRTASQLWLSYRRGPLGGRARSISPGDRVSDRDCRRTDGESIRLSAALGPAWVLLVPPGEGMAVKAMSATAAGRLGDSALTVLFDPTATDTARLVRPDGHLAWCGSDPAKLDHWLAAALSRGSVQQ